MLCGMPLAERRKVPGINPERADINIGGAAILDTLMDDLAVTVLQVSKRGLRDGRLMDYLDRTAGAQYERGASARRRSVLQLARSCRYDEDPGCKVADLAMQLLDRARQARLHSLGDDEREL